MTPSLLPGQALEAVQRGLGFQPMALEDSMFTRYRLVGATPDFAGGSRGASALRRRFAGQHDEAIELFEFDTSLGGGVFAYEASPPTESVNGQVARLTVYKSKTGKAVSVLTWENNRRHIELRVNRNVMSEGRAELIRLAESLPAPVPAQPDAPLPPVDDLPPPFGRGTQFPTLPPPEFPVRSKQD